MTTPTVKKNKPLTINGVVIVEGKSDTNKLKALFNVRTIETNGSALDEKTIALIKLAEQENQIILFLDPDGPGEKIRKQVVNILTKPFQQCFIKKTDMKKKAKKIGIAEANNEAIINAFQNLLTYHPQTNSLSLREYDELNLNSKQKRAFLCTYLKISLCNNKQLLKRLNMLGYDFKTLKDILDNENI